MRSTQIVKLFCSILHEKKSYVLNFLSYYLIITYYLDKFVEFYKINLKSQNVSFCQHLGGFVLPLLKHISSQEI